MRLSELGWNEFFQNQLNLEQSEDLIAARVSQEGKGLYRVLTEAGELLAEVSGAIRYRATGRTDFPAVGDWVTVVPRFQEGRATIRSILSRESVLVRKMAGAEVEEQIIAANLNIVFVVTSLNQDLNYRRIERYLATIWESGAAPVILLTKSDLIDDADSYCVELEMNTPGVPIHAISAVTGNGMELVARYLRNGRTAAFVGSSGAGKSTIINALAGDFIQPVQPIRSSDDRGRHTTTSRQLLLVPCGGIVIDTPGMRELQLWNADNGISRTFEDIEEFALNCKYRDCSHQGEPECAVVAAVEENQIPIDRLNSFRKLQAELKFLKSKTDMQSFQARKKYAKRISKAHKRMYKNT